MDSQRPNEDIEKPKIQKDDTGERKELAEEPCDEGEVSEKSEEVDWYDMLNPSSS
jgi:hypothetical protein